MATLEIPLDSVDAYFDVQVTLDGVALLLTFRWNARAEAWYLDISTAEGDVITASRKVVIDWPLMLRGFRDSDSRLPPGHLSAADTSNAGLRPGRYDLGGRVKLYYRDAEDILALMEENA
jgi:hypothetical protein